VERRRDAGVTTAQRVGLAAALAGGVVLRVWGLTDHGLWIDEYGTAWTVAAGAEEAARRAAAIYAQLPLYYGIVDASAAVFGAGPLGLRLPSLLFGIALLLLAYPLALRWTGDARTALLATVAVAVNEHLVYYSREARPYALALLGATASFHFFVVLLRGGGWRARLGYWAATALTWYAHYLFGVVIVVQALYVLARPPWRMARLRPWLANFGGLVPLLAPGLLALRSLFARREGVDWIETPSGAAAGLATTVDLIDPWLLVAVGLGLGVAWLRERRLGSLPDAARPGLAVLWLVVPVAAFVVAAPLLGVRLLHARYLAVAVPAEALLYGMLLGLARGGPLARAAPVALFVLASLGLRIEPLLQRDGGRFWWFLQHDWGRAVAALRAAHRPGDLVLYRTGFVELDGVVRGEASARTAEFARSPVRAHLPEDHGLELHPLPYRSTPELEARVAGAVASAAPRRVWLLGLDPEDPTSETWHALLDMAGPGLRPVRHRNFGVVHLALLRPAPPP